MAAGDEEYVRDLASTEGGGKGMKRWPRQETLALLQIRSEMDAAFRDANPKAPLWDQVSRKLRELGYQRSAKKCKEKFENLQKYYKRTKEGRGDGKSYKFFSQLEALDHHIYMNMASSTAPNIPLPQQQPQDAGRPSTSSSFGAVGISFSSDSSWSSSQEEEEEKHLGTEFPYVDRKRKRSDERMMEFFDGVMNKVMEKQKAMQQTFLEAMEKREQDRMIREEAWKRQDVARLAREHELMAQQRAISASRDAAIIAFLEKITGQTIHLPATTASQNPTPPQEPQFVDIPQGHPVNNSVAAAIPEQQQMIPVKDFTGSSSRWPKAEVLGLIQLRSGMESRYQELGPKGPLWEDISAGMRRMGYNRNAKKCKQKWENINKYFKKVKESNKERPQDSKTCPYFNELDALYRRKLHGQHTSVSIVGGSSSGQEQDVGIASVQPLQSKDDSGIEGGNTKLQTSTMGLYSSSLLQEQSDDHQGNLGGGKQPEDMLERQQRQISEDPDLMDIDCFNAFDTVDCSYSDQDNDERNHKEVGDHMKMAYKVEFKKVNIVGSSSGGGRTTTSFMAMVQ